MELKLGSVWLLLSCSLQQSLLGILASVPHSNAKRCKGTLSSGGERGEVKKVQMIRKIPAMCSGWDDAWSWLTRKDCRTKYVLDYIELPSEVQKTDTGDCEPEEAEASESSNFDVNDEKFMAIAFGSATVALLILIVIIVVSLVRRGQSRCGNVCGRRSSDYAAANGSDNEGTGGGHTCNEYVDEGLKLVEPEYEEIVDPNAKKEKPLFDTDTDTLRYQSMPVHSPLGDETIVLNGLNTSPIVPSAPLYEANFNQQTAVKSISTEHPTEFSPKDSDSVTSEDFNKFQLLSPDDSRLVHVPAQVETKVKRIDDDEQETIDDSKSKTNDDNDDKKKDNVNKEETCPKTGNIYSEFDDLVSCNHGNRTESHPTPAKTHSYENLDADQIEPYFTSQYDSLTHSPAQGDSPGIHCSPEVNSRAAAVETLPKELDSSLQMNTLKDIDPTDSPIQSEYRC